MLSSKKGHTLQIDGKTVKVDDSVFWGLIKGIKPESDLIKEDEYKMYQKAAREYLDSYKKGQLFHTSKFTQKAWLQFLKDNKVEKYVPQKGVTYNKKEKDVKNKDSK